jgi:hypothetical protein
MFLGKEVPLPPLLSSKLYIILNIATLPYNPQMGFHLDPCGGAAGAPMAA